LLALIIYRVKEFLVLIPVALFGGAATAFVGSYEDHLYEDRLRQWHVESVNKRRKRRLAGSIATMRTKSSGRSRKQRRSKLTLLDLGAVA
jgi:hypothetical protein